MTEERFKAGTFCWVELVTSDLAAAKDFYTQLLGWKVQETPLPDGSSYTILSVGKRGVGGAYRLTPELTAKGVPPYWASYVLVKDAAAAAQKAESLGATVVKEAFPVADFGRMAVITDPTGAAFCLWEVTKEPERMEALPQKTPGTVSWYELMTTDVDRAGGFYSKLFDWSPAPMNVGGMSYTIFKRGEERVAGMFALPDELRARGVPSSWGVYFYVADRDATVARAQKLGGRLLHGPEEVPEVGRIANLVDPQGVAFSVHQPAKK